MPENTDRRYWPKVSVPQDLIDLMEFVASKREDVDRADLHLLIYDLIAKAYPQDAYTMALMYESEWMAHRFNARHRKPPGEGEA